MDLKHKFKSVPKKKEEVKVTEDDEQILSNGRKTEEEQRAKKVQKKDLDEDPIESNATTPEPSKRK